MGTITTLQQATRATLTDLAGRVIGWIVAPRSKHLVGRQAGTVLLVRR
jgi:hypothetical protein